MISERDLYRAQPGMKRGLGFIRMTASSNVLVRQVEVLIRVRMLL